MKHKMYLQLISFLHTGMTQVVEIFPRVRQELTYSTWLLMFWRLKEPGISNHDIDYIAQE